MREKAQALAARVRQSDGVSQAIERIFRAYPEGRLP